VRLATHLIVAAGLVTASTWVAAVAPDPPAFQWTLPAGFPLPRVPADNPMTVAKVELGRHLFYDVRMSVNGTQSCATCHQQARAFTDGKALGVGATGEVHPRGPMSLVNVAFQASLTWANPAVTRLEDQALVPMYGDHPVELGLDRSDGWLAPLRQDAIYARLFASAFPEATDRLTREHVVQAIASFERSIISARSPYDRYHSDRDDSAVSPAARRGERLFFSQPLSCFRCHGGFSFSGATDFANRREGEVEFHNTGLYNLAGALSYPSTNTGIYEVTRRPDDVGKFKAPTLRNIAMTAPYMHDGSIATLPEVIAHYAVGGRTIADGPLKGVGHDNPNRSPSVRGFTIAPSDRDDLVAFLESLTDDALLRDPRFANPWPSHQLAP
jgi:cytochrome c peroxidase